MLVGALLDHPQVGGLPDEGAAVPAPKGREPVGPVVAEVLVQAGVGVGAEELADAFDGETSLSARVGWGRAGAAAGPGRPASRRPGRRR
jgi:hypothetical protein